MQSKKLSMSGRTEKETEQWCAWTKFVQQKNTQGVVIIFPTADGKSKRAILPGDDLPPEVTEQTILLCSYRPLTRHERRHEVQRHG